MKKRILSILLALCATAALALPAAAEQQAQEGEAVSIPVYLTVVRTARNIDVTLPASMPISKIDDTVLTADNLRITNNSTTQGVRVTAISVTGSGDYTIASYGNFPATDRNRIAMSINGCNTADGGGPLAINSNAFPDIAAGGYLPVRYQAQVSVTDLSVTQANAAQVIFTLAAI